VATAQPTEPERPPGIPETAFWNPSVGKWEVASSIGSPHAHEGESLRYRQDGSLFSRTVFASGVEDGPFTVYHPDGRVAREGERVAGRFEGLVTAYASDDPAGEPLRACCVPPNAVRLDARYHAGDLLDEVFYDRDGRVILSDGSLSPPRPAWLPELARFDEGRRVWTLRSQQIARRWTTEGVLLEETVTSTGEGCTVRTFGESGEITEEYRLAADGQRDGPFMRRLAIGNPRPYADTRVRQERGVFERGQAVGRWTFLDDDGAAVRTIDRGIPFDGRRLEASPAFAMEFRDGWALADALVGRQRVREALCAAARAAARDGNRAALARFLVEHVVALTPETAAERGELLARAGDLDVTTVLEALTLGTDAAAAFRALAGVLPGPSAAAADFVEASLLLAPERRMTHLTRALIRVQRGDVTGARADAVVVEAESPGAADSLLAYIRVGFRPFVFKPSAEILVPDPELESVFGGIGQTLEAIRHIVRVYATRLGLVRSTIRAIVGDRAEPDWLPPDVSALLLDGAETLRRESIACEPEEGFAEVGAPATVEIDEEIATDGLGVPALLALAQADHFALAWLCWASGLDQIALPEKLQPRETFTAAMKMIVKRHWRANNRATTGGLLAFATRTPGFEWQDMDIDLVPPHFLGMVAAEYLAARSMFLWLTSPEASSPFQNDLRDP